MTPATRQRPGVRPTRLERDDMAQGTCSISGCEKPHFGHGWCSMHYTRWRRYGSPHGGPTKSESISAINRIHKRTHGHATLEGTSPTFISWSQMLQRCENQNHTAYPRYGGRGIKVCKQWHLFETFLQDMGERPDSRSLDRIDNNGDYEPSNCRWATAKEQAQNRRRPRTRQEQGAS